MTFRSKKPYAAALLCIGFFALAACDKPAEDSAAAPEAATEATAEAPAKPLPVVSDAPAGAYALDKAHASLIFRVSHLGFSNFTGRFTKYDATLTFNPANPSTMDFTGKVDPSSLALDNPPAGFIADLLGSAWFDVAKYPDMSFKTTSVTVTGPNTAELTGDFTMHGVTKPLTLSVTFNGGYAGNIYDPQARIGFSAHGTLKRSDYGMGYGIPAPGTNMGVSDEVELILESEFNGPAWINPDGTTPPASAP
ncbi:MAG: YceI family protein [Parvibaculaceae bacterium]